MSMHNSLRFVSASGKSNQTRGQKFSQARKATNRQFRDASDRTVYAGVKGWEAYFQSSLAEPLWTLRW